MCQSRSPILSLIEYPTRLPITTQLSNSCRRYLCRQTKLPRRNRTIPAARRAHSGELPGLPKDYNYHQFTQRSQLVLYATGAVFFVVLQLFAPWRLQF